MVEVVYSGSLYGDFTPLYITGDKQQEVFGLSMTEVTRLRTVNEIQKKRIRELEKLLNETIPEIMKKISDGKDSTTDD